jgi:hypothetical protein
VTEFTELQEKHEKDKKLWVSSMQVLNAKIQVKLMPCLFRSGESFIPILYLV